MGNGNDLKKAAGIGKRPAGIKATDAIMRRANVGGRPDEKIGNAPGGLGGRQYDKKEPFGGDSVKDGKKK